MTDQHTVQAGTQTIAVRKDLRVPMRDGITLAADTRSAVDDTPRPALVLFAY